MAILFALTGGVALILAQQPAETAAQGRPGKTVDLTRIERKILEDPENYVGKKQQYCLLVFGPEAKFRVWLVHDADILYVDHDGDGHIEHGWQKRIRGNHTGHFKVGDILDRSRKVKHENLFVTFHKHEGSLSILIDGKIVQRAEFTPSENPGDAPIVHLNGPISLRLRDPQGIAIDEEGRPSGVEPRNVLYSGREVLLGGYLETPGLHAFARYRARDVFYRGRLTVELEFSKRGADSVRSRGVMTEFMEGDFEMEGAVWVPDNAPVGEAELRVTFPANKEVSLLPPLVRKIRIYEK